MSAAPTKSKSTGKRSLQHSDKRGRRSSVLPDVRLGRIAEDANISIGYLSKLLRGIGNPSIPTARRVAGVMGLTLEEFLAQIEGQRQRQTPKSKQ